MFSLNKHCLILFFSLAVSLIGYGQTISGTVFLGDKHVPAKSAIIILENTYFQTMTDEKGHYTLKNISPGNYKIIVFQYGYETKEEQIIIDKSNLKLDFLLPELEEQLLKEVIVKKEVESHGSAILSDIEGTAIYAAKKNEVLLLDDISSNKATNNARQLFSRVAGLNIWESDGAGLQLGIAARGLNPSRTSGFNTRLNGYDMSADAIGYPESYYTPPAESLDKIQVVRGAASLQYGTQFGGMINFIPKSGVNDKKIELTSRQTYGSCQFINSFNSIGGTIDKLNYYGYFHHKQGNGWRENSDFSQNAGFVNLKYKASNRLSIGINATVMEYLAHQPGGLTDKLFNENPRQSIRDRNWFKVGWNLGAITIDYNLTESITLNSITYGLLASRYALGNLDPINRQDAGGVRNLLKDQYSNFGNETRLLKKYKWKEMNNTFLVGIRYYQGHLDRKQGFGTNGSDADFSYYDFENTASSTFTFPSRNIAIFSESIFQVTDDWTLTPGFRYEYIATYSKGEFTNIYYDNAGNILEQVTQQDRNNRVRNFPLFGLGTAYYIGKSTQMYGNISQNYRAITFNDMRVTNPSLRVDTLLQDENGFNIDLGWRGSIKSIWTFDITLFYLSYNDRIGLVQKIDPQQYNIYRLRTNIADSRTYGIESFIDCDILKLLNIDSSLYKLSAFLNTSLLDSKYINSDESAFNDKKVELVPNLIFKTGIRFTYKNFATNFNFAYTSKQYTDATNADFTPNAINGLVPSYWVSDLSAQYSWRKITTELSINNLTNNMYFTRRADGYPGPGIIPSDGRTYYLTLQFKL